MKKDEINLLLEIQIPVTFSHIVKGLWGLYQICIVAREKISASDFSFPLINDNDYKKLLV